MCDGSSMQRVPGSLRYLASVCRESGVPLYVLNDPRTWGCQTHPTLSDAIADMKRTVSDNIVRFRPPCSFLRSAKNEFFPTDIYSRGLIPFLSFPFDTNAIRLFPFLEFYSCVN